VRESLIMIALQECNLRENNDLIHMSVLHLLVDSWPWLLIPNFYWCMLLSVVFHYEPSTLLRSEAIRWTSLLLVGILIVYCRYIYVIGFGGLGGSVLAFSTRPKPSDF